MLIWTISYIPVTCLRVNVLSIKSCNVSVVTPVLCHPCQRYCVFCVLLLYLLYLLFLANHPYVTENVQLSEGMKHQLCISILSWFIEFRAIIAAPITVTVNHREHRKWLVRFWLCFYCYHLSCFGTLSHVRYNMFMSCFYYM